MEETLPIHNPDAAASLATSIVVDGNDDVNAQQKLEEKHKRTSIFTAIVCAIILASFGFQGLAIGLNINSTLIIISGIAGCIVASTAAVKQLIMQRMDSLRVVHNKIRMEVNRFMEENNKLTRNVDGLEDQVVKLQDLEKQLAIIAENQNSTAEELVSLVKENSITLEKQKILAKADLQEQLLATVLRTDRNGDLQIDEREANVLILRMKNHGGVDFDEERVRNALVKTNGSLPALLEIIREIGRESDEDDADEVDGADNVVDMRKSTRLVRIDDRKFMESIRTIYSNPTGSSSSMLDFE